MIHSYSVINALASELEHAMSRDDESDPGDFVDAVLSLERLREALSAFLETSNNA